MPWALLTRWLLRALAGMIVWRVAASRRGAYAGAHVPGGRSVPVIDPRRAAAAVRDGAVLTSRAIGALVLVVAVVVLTTAGVTMLVLGPRWLGGILSAAALGAAIAATLDLRVLVRSVIARRRVRHDEALRSQVS